MGRAENLIHEAKIEEALQILNDFKKKKALSSHEQISYYCLKALIAFYFLDRVEYMKYAKKAYQESQKLENSLLLLDVYITMANSLLFSSKPKEASKFIRKSEDLMRILPQKLSSELKIRKAYILWGKGVILHLEGDLEKAKEFREKVLVLLKELDLKVDIANMLYQLGAVSLQIGDLNHALEYTEASKNLLINLNWKHFLYLCHKQFANIYYMKGELDQAISYNEQILAFAENENNYRIRLVTYNHIGILYQEKGDFKRALENMEKSINIAEENGTNYEIFGISDRLFHLALDMKNTKQTQLYLNRMKQIVEEEDLKRFKIPYNIDRALYLKIGSRALNRGKAEEILKQLIEEGISDFELLTKALLNLCDLLLIELSATNEPEILDELQVYISQLFEAVKNSRSYSLLAEIYLLQARLALITLNMKKARQMLNKAQEIAEKYGLNRLAIKISTDHDELLKNLDNWSKLKESEAPLSERMKLAQLNEQMGRMVRKREIDVPELTDEDPIVLLIISEAGRPVFSESFVEEWTFEDHLFGGFLTAINSFSDQMFSEGLNRANFGEYTIIMNSLHPFLVCYLFKGQSYSAQQRITYFMDKLQNDELIWQTFNKFYQINKEVQICDVPSLEPLITKIFIDKSVPLIA